MAEKMTLPEEVVDAMERMDGYACVLPGLSPCLPIIRAHLLAQDTEIERLRESTHYANGVADLAMKHRDAAESRLAAADALLRECYGFMQSQSIDQQSWGETLSLGEKITAHLSENGHE